MKRVGRSKNERLEAVSTARPFSGITEYTQQRQGHWDEIAASGIPSRWLGSYYHRRLASVYTLCVGSEKSVLEIGCGEGDLLAACEPKTGVGIDFSRKMVQTARSKHQHLHFVAADAHAIPLDQAFDVIILSDLVNDLWDVEHVLGEVRRLSHPRTRIILNFFSRIWELPLKLAERMGLARPMMPQNWLTKEDLDGLFRLVDLETIQFWREIIWPISFPILDDLSNKIIARSWPIHHFCLTNMLIARPAPAPVEQPPSVSIIVPARNEAGNIEAAITRTPDFEGGTEIIFVEGHSQDNTLDEIKSQIAGYPEKQCMVLQQPGEGKGDAVRWGFKHASGDILMILDADLTVPPEDLMRFYSALVSRQAEFANGVRLVYPLEGRAMRFFNLLGNKGFSFIFSWLLGQDVKDTLCGTKVLWQLDYKQIESEREYFGDFDPFGDFDLLFGAAKQNLRIVDVPIRYRSRSYGSTNIHRWQHGALLLRMAIVGSRRLKFI